MKLAPAGISNILTEERYGGRYARTWVVVSSVVFGVTVIVVALVFGITKASRAAGAASCRHFSAVSGYTSNYQIQHFLDGGTCYVRLSNGHSLPLKQVVGYIKAGR